MATSPPTTHADVLLRPSSVRRDLASAYLATAARIVAWAVISAVVYRRQGEDAFAVLALIRSTVGLLTYAALGVGPAMVKFLADADRPAGSVPRAGRSASYDGGGGGADDAPREPNVLGYADRRLAIRDVSTASPFARVCASGWHLATFSALGGLALAFLYADNAADLHRLTSRDVSNPAALIFLMGAGMVLRLLSEPAGSVAQVRGRIALDNLLVALSELTWMFLTILLVSVDRPSLVGAGLAFAASAMFLVIGRGIALGYAAPEIAPMRARPEPAIVRRLLGFGLAVVVAQSADFLYAPTDFILIKALLDTDALAAYAPAVQIDGGLLLIVTGLASVLLPRAALAHAARDAATVRAYYVRGTLASLGLLAMAACAVWLLAPTLLKLWLGEDLPATRAVLPLVLVHTVVGGSGAVGRSVLLAMGKVKPFAISVLLAGAGNGLLSYAFVRHLHLGLRGIVYATIVVVVLRCAVWMPWYVMRTLRAHANAPPLPQ